MNIIETTAPITIENLKLFFENKETKYLIDYEKSILKEEKLLVYLSNLEIYCDIKFSNVESFDELLKIYLKSSVIVKMPSLEFGLIDFCCSTTKSILWLMENLLKKLKKI